MEEVVSKQMWEIFRGAMSSVVPAIIWALVTLYFDNKALKREVQLLQESRGDDRKRMDGIETTLRVHNDKRECFERECIESLAEIKATIKNR